MNWQELLRENFEGCVPGALPTGWGVSLPAGGVGDPPAQSVDDTMSVSGTNSLRMVDTGCGNVN